MGTGGAILFLFFFLTVSGLFCAMIAAAKRRSAAIWFVVGVLLPFISWFVVIFVPPEKKKALHFEKLAAEQRRLRELLLEERGRKKDGAEPVSRNASPSSPEAAGRTAPLPQESALASPPSALRASRWFARVGRRMTPPLPFLQLKYLYRIGHLDEETLVKRHEETEWKPVKDVEGLLDELKKAENA